VSIEADVEFKVGMPASEHCGRCSSSRWACLAVGMEARSGDAGHWEAGMALAASMPQTRGSKQEPYWTARTICRHASASMPQRLWCSADSAQRCLAADQRMHVTHICRSRLQQTCACLCAVDLLQWRGVHVGAWSKQDLEQPEADGCSSRGSYSGGSGGVCTGMCV